LFFVHFGHGENESKDDINLRLKKEKKIIENLTLRRRRY